MGMRKLDFWRSGEFLGLFVGVMPPGCGRLTRGLARSAPVDHASDWHRLRSARADILGVTSALLVTDGAFPVPLTSDTGPAAGTSQLPEHRLVGARAAFARPLAARAG
jgi:hypothetical protein